MKIIAANFKMNGDREFIDNWFQNFDANTENLVVVGLPAIYLESSVQNFNKSHFKIAAQNVSKFNNPGAYTGQMSSAMLNDVGVEFCIVGHSEAREHLCEDNQSVYEKYNCLKVYTTRHDTLFGMSFAAISADHPLTSLLEKNDPELTEFIKMCRKTSTNEEALEKAEKIGYRTNVKVLNPFNEKKSYPLFVANFVLMDYGTGAIFGCPAHDQRDLDFANKFDLDVIPVVCPSEIKITNFKIKNEAYTGPGNLINSDFINGLSIEEAKKAVSDKLNEVTSSAGSAVSAAASQVESVTTTLSRAAGAAMAAASYSLDQAATEIANTISAGVSVDLDAAAQGLGHDSFAAAVEAYNEQYGTSYTVDSAKEALGQ